MASFNNSHDLEDAARELLYQLEDLVVPFEELSDAVESCIKDRWESDMRSAEHTVERRKERIAIESRLEYIRAKSAELKQQRDAVIARIPPQLRPESLGVLDLAEAEFHAEMLKMEMQMLLGGAVMNEYTHDELIAMRADLETFQDPVSRAHFQAALDQYATDAAEFREIYGAQQIVREEAIREQLRELDVRCAAHIMTPMDETDDSPEHSTGVTSVTSEISDLNLGPPAIPLEKQLEEYRLGMGCRLVDDSMFRFDRNNPPSLSTLAAWLGFDDGVDVALILNLWPIHNAFQTHRSVPGHSCAEKPERLKLVLPLFTYPRDTLQLWDTHEENKKGQKGEYSLDIRAALFANHVVRFLERSCEEVAWGPVSGDIANLEDFEVARRRWAVVLQIFWFMEKAFGNAI